MPYFLQMRFFYLASESNECFKTNATKTERQEKASKRFIWRTQADHINHFSFLER